MLRRPNLLLSSSIDSLLKAVRGVLPPKQALTLTAVQSQLPEDVCEDISENHGGLLSFARQHASLFGISRSPTGMWMLCATDAPLPRKRVFVLGREEFEIPDFALSVRELSRFHKETEDTILASLGPSLASGDITAVHDGNEAFVVSTSNPQPQAHSAYSGMRPPKYDACRAARCLSCDRPTPLTELRKTAEPIVTRPLAQVFLSFPKRFACDFTDVDDGTFPSSYGPRLRTLSAVTYVCHPWHLENEMYVSEAYRNLTIAQLQEALDSVRRVGGKRSFKATKERRKIIQAMLAQQFPKGNPLIDPDVTAHYLYDLLETTPGFMPVDQIREWLPENGRITCQTHNAFFEKFPNLFHLDDGVPTALKVKRADSGPALEHRQLSPAALVLSIASTLPANIDSDRWFAISASSQTSKRVAREIRRQHGCIENFFLKYNETFDIKREDGHVWIRTDAERLAAWCKTANDELATEQSRSPQS